MTQQRTRLWWLTADPQSRKGRALVRAYQVVFLAAVVSGVVNAPAAVFWGLLTLAGLLLVAAFYARASRVHGQASHQIPGATPPTVPFPEPPQFRRDDRE